MVCSPCCVYMYTINIQCADIQGILDWQSGLSKIDIDMCVSHVPYMFIMLHTVVSLATAIIASVSSMWLVYIIDHLMLCTRDLPLTQLAEL